MITQPLMLKELTYQLELLERLKNVDIIDKRTIDKKNHQFADLELVTA